MSFKVTPLILVILLSFSSYSVEASSVQTARILGDTYVDSYALSSNFGQEPYLKVADSNESSSLAFLMFDLSGVSYAFNVSSEVELRLYCYNITSPYVIGVHWCLNNTWSEGTLTFASIQNFSRTNEPESVAVVSSNDTWYEWRVTGFADYAMQQPAYLDKITLTLQIENSSVATYGYVFFYSKDQSLSQYYPQLVFFYRSGVMNPSPVDMYLVLGSISVVTVGMILVAYRFLGKKKRKRYFGRSLSRHVPI